MHLHALTLLLILSFELQAAPRDGCRWALTWLTSSPQSLPESHQVPDTARTQEPAAATKPQHEATSSQRFDEISHHLDFLLGILREHPNLVTSNLSFGRSLLETLSHISELQKQLGSDAASMHVTATHFSRANYSFNSTKERISVFLGQRVRDLAGLGLFPGGDLSTQLTHIKATSTKGHDFDMELFKRRTTRLLRLLPFLFDPNGRARFNDLSDPAELERASNFIRRSSPEDLSNHYGALINEPRSHQIEAAANAPEMEERIKHYLKIAKRDLVDRAVGIVLTLVRQSDGAVVTRRLTLERLPNSVALFRGCYGGDCSLLSVPSYPLVKESRTYFIRKGDDLDAMPSGYAFSVLVEANGKKVPYIITINGVTLLKIDVEMAVRMVAEDYGTDTVVVADLEKNNHLVNSANAIEGLSAIEGKRVQVAFPKDWGIVEKFTNNHPAKDLEGEVYTNFYDSSQIAQGYLVSIPKEDKRLSEPIAHATADSSRYRFNNDLSQVPVLERAILANQVLIDLGIPTKDQTIEVHNRLNVTDAQVQAAKPLVEMSPSRPLIAAEFHAAEQLGFGIKYVLSHALETRAATLKSLLEKEPQLLSSWREMGSGRLSSAIAFAYGIENQILVNEIINASKIGTNQAVTVLRHLNDAYNGNLEAMGVIVENVPAETRALLLGNVAQGLLERSNTDNARAVSVISGLMSQDAEIRNRFLTIHRHWMNQDPTPLGHAVHEITARINGNGGYGAAEKHWLSDKHVSPDLKAEYLRVREQMGEALTSLVPKPQREAVAMAARKHSNINAFEELAATKGTPGENLLAGANQKSFEFVEFRIPQVGQKFRVGSPPGEQGRYDNESQREVTITQGFKMQATTVTQRQWKLVMKSNPSNFSGDLDLPVEQISWWSAVVYANRLSELEGRAPVYDLSGIKFTGKAEDGTLDAPQGRVPQISETANGYRLPTEAEWEIAVRAGTKTRFSSGDSNESLNDVAWLSANSDSKTHAVASKRPNANGLYDMHGNVCEWMQDFYENTPQGGVNPQGPSVGSGRVIRGGSYNLDAQSLRSAHRHYLSPGSRSYTVGFRLLLRTLNLDR